MTNGHEINLLIQSILSRTRRPIPGLVTFEQITGTHHASGTADEHMQVGGWRVALTHGKLSSPDPGPLLLLLGLLLLPLGAPLHALLHLSHLQQQPVLSSLLLR